MEEASIALKIIKNTKFNALGRIWEVLIRLFLTPYIILKIGGDRYGIWAIVTVVTGYFSILDLGVGESFLKYFAEFFAKREEKKINEVANTGFVFYLVIGVIISLIAFPFINVLLNFFKIESAMYNEALFALRLGFFVLVFSSIFGVFSFIPLGLQRMEVTNGISIGLSIPYTIGTILFLEMGFGLRGLMINTAINASMIVFANLLVSYKLFRGFSFNPFKHFSASMLMKLIQFGYKLKIMHIARLVNRNLDKLLIGHFLTMGFVTYYHLGSTIVDKAQILPYILISALLPAFGELYIKKGGGKLVNGYLKGTKYLSFLVIPFYIFIFVSARNLLLLWMGPGYARSMFVLRVLSIGWMVYCLSWVTRPILKTIEKHKIQMFADIIIVVLNISLSLILIIKFGFNGIVFGTMIALITGGIFLFMQFHRLLKISLVKLIKTIFFITVASITAGILIYVVDCYIQMMILSQDRLLSFLILFFEGSLFSLVYFAFLRFVKPFDVEDKDLLGKHITITRPIIGFLTRHEVKT